ncbi:hypothetical protein BT93_F1310 [Corymbia citriodora subsp. variegata]|nr:hypothetical protein BT93_F1310 [Corymbia citriodora subsp. variegata]
MRSIILYLGEDWRYITYKLTSRSAVFNIHRKFYVSLLWKHVQNFEFVLDFTPSRLKEKFTNKEQQFVQLLSFVRKLSSPRESLQVKALSVLNRLDVNLRYIYLPG